MLPLAQDERTVADEGRRLRPLVAALGDHVLAGGRPDPDARDRVEVGRRVGQREGDVVATNLDAVQERCLRGRDLRGIVLLRVHAVPGFAADHDVAGEGIVTRGGRIAETLPSVLEVVGSDGLAVRVLEPVAEGVRVGLAVGADLRLVLRRGRDHLAGLDVRGHERLEHPHGHADLIYERFDLWVDGVGLRAHIGGELSVGVRLVSSAAGVGSAARLRAGADDQCQKRHER